MRGSIFCTPATADLCEIMLKDAAHIMAEDAERGHAEGGYPYAPLYDEKDVERAIGRFRVIGYGRSFVQDELAVRFHDAGHIIGSSMLEIEIKGKKLIFSGDIGRQNAPFLRDPYQIKDADWLVMESTYGDRDHEPQDKRGERLFKIVKETAEQGGNIVVPAFAVGRTQEILFELNSYAEAGLLGGLQCFVDSPLAISATEIYARHPECFDSETLEMLRRGDNPLEFPGIKYVRSREESKAINSRKEPHIIISASGMCTGGRVLHHLYHNLERPNSTIVFVGYQAEGTLGRQLLSGAGKVKVMGKELKVKARIESLAAFSAHAGRSELLNWLEGFESFPSQIFLNHGETTAVDSLARLIHERFDVRVKIPAMGEVVSLD